VGRFKLIQDKFIVFRIKNGNIKLPFQFNNKNKFKHKENTGCCIRFFNGDSEEIKRQSKYIVLYYQESKIVQLMRF
jgi:hypothetical protein